MTNFMTCPFRFTQNLPQMTKFFEFLGLKKTISRNSGYACFQSANGYLALHASTAKIAGKTQLEFLTNDFDEAQQSLAAAGLKPQVWDEAYARHLAVQEPNQAMLWVAEAQNDFYGYQTFHPENHSPLEVVMVYYSQDFTQARDFFRHFGYFPIAEGDSWWQELHTEKQNHSGHIGLHYFEPAEVSTSFQLDFSNPVAKEVTAGKISFNTVEPLNNLLERLLSNGYQARKVEEHGTKNIKVIDPDNVLIEIHTKA